MLRCGALPSYSLCRLCVRRARVRVLGLACAWACVCLGLAQMVKGTSMAFPGFKKETDRADVIAYLHAITDGTADQKKGHH